MAQRIWPQIKEALAEARTRVNVDLEAAKSNNLFVGGLNEIWQAVNEGRADVLVVEEDLHIAAEVSDDGREITEILGGSVGQNGYADIVDEIIEKALATGAQALTVASLSPQGEVARVRQVVVKFDSAAVSFGDP